MNIEAFTNNYTGTFKELLGKLEAFDGKGSKIDYSKAIDNSVKIVADVQAEKKKIMMIGNGGSAGIASHQAIDYWKNGGVKAMTFNDSSLLTCISNDFSYAEVFSKPIEMFAEKGDLLIAISSSGSSMNILNAVQQANASSCKILTFSGFKNDNPLLKTGDINFFVPSYSYGYVEILHLFIIHTILDAKLYCLDKKDVFNKNLPY